MKVITGLFNSRGVGMLFGVGWLIAAFAGTAGVAGGLAGGLIGSMTEAVGGRDTHICAQAIRRGGTIVTGGIDAAKLDITASILCRHGKTEIPARRAEYMARGWTGFETTLPHDTTRAVPPPSSAR